MYAKMIFPQYKVKMSHILQNMYMFCRFDEVLAIRKPKIITSSKPVPKYSLRISFFLLKQNDIPHTGKPLTTLKKASFEKGMLIGCTSVFRPPSLPPP